MARSGRATGLKYLALLAAVCLASGSAPARADGFGFPGGIWMVQQGSPPGFSVDSLFRGKWCWTGREAGSGQITFTKTHAIYRGNEADASVSIHQIESYGIRNGTLVIRFSGRATDIINGKEVRTTDNPQIVAHKILGASSFMTVRQKTLDGPSAYWRYFSGAEQVLIRRCE